MFDWIDDILVGITDVCNTVSDAIIGDNPVKKSKSNVTISASMGAPMDEEDDDEYSSGEKFAFAHVAHNTGRNLDTLGLRDEPFNYDHITNAKN